jgi:hypothetical protein
MSLIAASRRNPRQAGRVQLYYNGSGHRQDHLFVLSHNVTHGPNRYGEVNSKSANDGDDVLHDRSNLDCLTVWESIYVISTTKFQEHFNEEE